MAKELIKQAGLGAVESILQTLMPELLARFDALDGRFDKLDARTEKFEQRLSGIESRIHAVETSLRQQIHDLGMSLRKEINDFSTSHRQDMNEFGTALRQEISHLGTSIRQEMVDGTDQTRDVINELGQRQSKLEGAVELNNQLLMRTTDAVYDLIDRVAVVEATGLPRKRKTLKELRSMKMAHSARA